MKQDDMYDGHVSDPRSGVTLVEVVIALALVTLMCGGLFAVGLRAQRFGEHNRSETEAASMARERLEEMVAMGRENLALQTCSLRNTVTNSAVMGKTVVRVPRLLWHAGDGSVTNASDSVYAEAHVDVTYYSPLYDQTVTKTYSTLIK